MYLVLISGIAFDRWLLHFLVVVSQSESQPINWLWVPSKIVSACMLGVTKEMVMG